MSLGPLMGPTSCCIQCIAGGRPIRSFGLPSLRDVSTIVVPSSLASRFDRAIHSGIATRVKNTFLQKKKKEKFSVDFLNNLHKCYLHMSN